MSSPRPPSSSPEHEILGGEAVRKEGYRRGCGNRPDGQNVPGEGGRGAGKAAAQDRAGASLIILLLYNTVVQY